jgi:cadmium resistance protein CadD (predicted permease)
MPPIDDLLSVLGIGVAVFASTNIDDIFLLSVFFADPHLRARTVVLGQFVGMGALVLASAIAALAAFALPEGWTALLGIAPLVLGLWKLRTLRGPEAHEDGVRLHSEELAAERRTRSQVLAVAAVTIANGGDNLGVYIPLFAKTPSAMPAYGILFLIMTGLWCVLGYWLVNNRVLGSHFRRYGRVSLPFVLIGLGLYILWGARALAR